MDPNGGRKRNVTGSASTAKRGDALSGGPVGRSDGYAGRGGGSTKRESGSGSTGGSGGMRIGGGKGLLYLIIVLLLGGGGGLTAFLTGGGGGGDTSTGGGSINPTAIFSGFTGNNSVSTGWQDGLNNTSKLNTEVASGTPAKRTTIKGNGNDTITIMLYMCGTDLESKSGMASNDLAEMLSAPLSDKINLIIYTGGCSMWRTTGISSEKNQIYKATGGRLERLVADDGNKAMTDPATLTGFIKYCKENYPADRNELILWDHGGGSITGYGYDETHKSAGSMDLVGINKALSDAGMTFDFIGFDTCLMATLENGLMLSKYADYMIASEETEPGLGWYYTPWLTELSKNTSMPTIEIGKNIVDSFVDECARKCQGQKTTLSVVDLAELAYTVPDKLSAFSKDTSTIIKSDDYKKVSDARAGAREFATSSGIDQIDLVNFTNSIGTKDAKALSDTLLSAVKYNRTGSTMTNAYGLSIYFPYKKTGKVKSVVASYNNIGMDAEYARCIQSFAGLSATGQVSAGGAGNPLGSLLGGGGSGGASGQDAISQLLGNFLMGRSMPGMDTEDYADYMSDSSVFDQDQAVSYVASHQFDTSKLVWKEENGSYTMALADDQWDLINRLEVNMFLEDEDGYIDLGLDNVYEFNDEGKLVGATDNAWLAIDGQPVAYYYEDTVKEGDHYAIYGRVPVILNGDTENRANLIIIFDNEHPSGYIAGARYDYVEGVNANTETVAKSMTELTEGTTIDFVCDHYDYDGTYGHSYMLGTQITYNKDIKVSDTIVEGNCKVTYLLTDLYGCEYWTPAVPN